jgi:hypothetical protein
MCLMSLIYPPLMLHHMTTKIKQKTYITRLQIVPRASIITLVFSYSIFVVARMLGMFVKLKLASENLRSFSHVDLQVVLPWVWYFLSHLT